MQPATRLHGEPPYAVAVIHGGPGALGSAAPIAAGLSSHHGVIEPMQTQSSVSELVEELRIQLDEHASAPVVLIGHSWGAMLSHVFAARHSDMVCKVIMVGSGCYESRFTRWITDTRLRRLSKTDRAEALSLIESLAEPDGPNMCRMVARLGELFASADAYDAIASDEADEHPSFCDANLHAAVWADAKRMRDSGELLAMGRGIGCPVVAIHGDYDPHPVEGVRDPLTGVIEDFRFVLLRKCGHEPWKERHARERFFGILLDEIGSAHAD